MRNPDRRPTTRNPSVALTTDHTTPRPAGTPQRLLRSKPLLGMQVDGVDLHESVRYVLRWSRSSTAHLVVTPNTDHFLRWQSDPSFRELYEAADLVTIDGAPLALLARLEGVDVQRVTGIDLFSGAVAAAAAAHVPVILIGGLGDVASLAATNLMRDNPGLEVPFVTSPSADDLRSNDWLHELAFELAKHPTKIVALCLGSPKQEQLFDDLLTIDPNLSGSFLCVGASIDFAAGTLRRAPRIFQKLGIEWMFRLVSEPRRLWRRYLVDDIQIIRYLARSVSRGGLRRLRARPTGKHVPVDTSSITIDVPTSHPRVP